MSDIFVSYSRADSKIVEALILALIEYGWSVWSDKSGVAEGRPFDQQIENAILDSTVTLVVWSPASIKSRWVRAEAAFALGKDKLLPVIVDNVDPPLQFLHIHGANLTDWSWTSNDSAFKKLAAILSERLDRVGRIPDAEKEAAGSAQLLGPSTNGMLASWKAALDALFPPVGKGFNEYFTKRTFFITQFACIFSFCLVTLFGLVDFFVKAGGVEQTRFRFVVSGPSLLVMLALSFTPWVKRNSQIFATLFATMGLLIVFETSSLVENAFPVNTGAPTTAFMTLIAVLIVIPLRVPGAAFLGLLALLMNECYIVWTHKPLPPGLHAGYDFCVLSGGLALVAAAYFRERLIRQDFLMDEQAMAKIAELKERLMALAVQRNQQHEKSSSTKPAKEKSNLGRTK